MTTNLEKLNEFLQEAEVPVFTNQNVTNDYLNIPKNLTEIPTSELGKHLNAIVQQKMYVRTLASQARAVYREAKSLYDKEKYRVFVSAPPRMSVTEKELRVYQDEEAEKSKEFMEYSLEKFDMLKDLLESYDDGVFLLSRELTRRLKDVDDVNRSGKFNA